MKSTVYKRKPLILLISAALILAACHSKKEVTAVTRENYDIEANGSFSTATAARMQWMSNLALDIDSFELFVPIDHFADIGNMAGDTAAMPNTVPTVAGMAGNIAARQPRQGSVVLRAKHASIGKSDMVERNSVSCAQQDDSIVAHRTMDKQEHTASDTVKMAKPPDMTWLPWIIVAVAVAMFIFVVWRMDKQDKKYHGSDDIK